MGSPDGEIVQFTAAWIIRLQNDLSSFNSLNFYLSIFQNQGSPEH